MVWRNLERSVRVIEMLTTPRNLPSASVIGAEQVVPRAGPEGRLLRTSAVVQVTRLSLLA